ncbi:MAG: DivIVA domain-containing protein [Deltaproteobacteria bacterium]|nr:DivIVA domain-containing protein [Deltaproteobacteria bacterium]
MSLTAEDIQTKQFHVRFRGFDIEEVDTFLERIAENFALVNDDKRLLKEQVEKLEMEINRFHSQEKTFHHAIISAQKIADEMQEKSRLEAEARLAAVQEEVDRLRKEITLEKQILEQEIVILKENKKKVKEELRDYLQKNLSWLEQDLISLLQSDISGTGKPRQAEAMVEKKAEPRQETEVNDLDDLYEKIELPGALHLSGPQPGEDDFMAAGRRDNFSAAGEDEGEERENLTIPDLEGDMLFSLEDPLDDDHEPKVTFDQAEDEDFKNVRVK